MKGFISKGGVYYESCEGPLSLEDVMVPLRPSPEYVWDGATRCWLLWNRGHMLHHYPRFSDRGVGKKEEPVVKVGENFRVELSVKLLVELLVVFAGGVAVYYAIRQDIRDTQLALDHVSVQVREMKSDLKSRLERLEEWFAKVDRGRAP